MPLKGGYFQICSFGTRLISFSSDFHEIFLSIKAVIRKCSSKWVLLKTSQYSQKNTCVGVYFS